MDSFVVIGHPLSDADLALIRERFGTERLYDDLEVCRRCHLPVHRHDLTHCEGGVHLGFGAVYRPYDFDPGVQHDTQTVGGRS